MNFDVNKINYDRLSDDPNIAIKVGEVIDNISWKYSNYESLFGKGDKRPIRHFDTDSSSPFRPRLKAPLQGEGVRGNADLSTNYDHLEIFAQTIDPHVIGNSLRSEILQYSNAKKIDFLKEATQSLADWMQRFRDNAFGAALANDPTNFVVADKTNGFKDSSKDADALTSAKKVVAGDVVNVKMLRRAIFMAQNGIDYQGKATMALAPTHVESYKSNGFSTFANKYVILLDTYQINQLKSDPEWREIQKADNRGSENSMLTGFAGVIDGCPVLDMGVYSTHGVGLFNSSIPDSDYLKYINKSNYSKITTPSMFKPTGTDVSMGFLLGAGALLHIGSDSKFYTTKDGIDAGRKVVCGVDRVLGIAKARFEVRDSSSPYSYMDGKDFSTIALFSSKE